MVIVPREKHFHKFSAINPAAAAIESGEVVLFQTIDSRSGTLFQGELKYETPIPPDISNPVTGPVAVIGAQPGDTLVVDILKIELASQGFVTIRPDAGMVTKGVGAPRGHLINIVDNWAIFNEKIRFPIRPMVGVIGTTPKETVYSIHAGIHGGNMDNNLIAPGARVFLPVFVSEGLLGIGDIHACMGDGESTGGGIDIPAQVLVQVHLLKDRPITRPFIETEQSWISTGGAPDIQAALSMAVEEMALFLQNKLEITWEDALMLISATGDVQVCQAAHLKIECTARCVFPKVFNN